MSWVVLSTVVIAALLVHVCRAARAAQGRSLPRVQPQRDGDGGCA